MRTHSAIIGNADTARQVADVTGKGIHTVRSWGQRNSIPAQHWTALVNAGLATLEELARAAARPSDTEARAA